MFDLPSGVLFGAAYYPEYQTSDRLAEDMRLMQAAGFSVIRVGESTWSTWEPEDGRFDLDWLEPTLDAARDHDIAVILGTPTYAVPPWLARKYPEIAAERRTGERIGWGARQEMDFTHPAFRFHAERVIRNVVGRYSGHPAIIGYQVDNEPGLELFYNRGVFQRFVDELRQQYGDVETLNNEWGLAYWSHRLSTWADLWTPDNNSVPQYDLAWRRFQSRLTNEFIAWQAGIVRGLVSPDKFVTTCVAYSRPAVDDAALDQPLDVAAGNLYFGMEDALGVPEGASVSEGWATTGTGRLFMAADRVYSSRQEPFLITETDAGGIGGPAMNYPGFDGQWRQVAWAMIARGARLIEYWHWNTLPWGAETYWTGILPHDEVPGRVYEQIAALGNELRDVGSSIDGLVPDASVGLLWSNPSAWALTFQPPFSDSPVGQDATAYGRIIDAFYGGAFDAGIQVRIIHDSQVVGVDADLMDPAAVAKDLPALLVPGLYVASDRLLDWLRRYAEAGGHLVLGPRSAYADEEARARKVAKPALLADLAGATYQELANLVSPIGVTAKGFAHADSSGLLATELADGLLPDAGTEVLAGYDHPHYGKFAAVTTRQAGKGRVTVVGTVPNPALSKALAQWIVPSLDSWQRLTKGSVTVSSATLGDGRKLRVVHNWSWQPVTVHLPESATELSHDEALLPGGTLIDLGAWDVRIFLQSQTES